MSKIEQAKQTAFEAGADYATSYIIELIEVLAGGIENHDAATASLLKYISGKASEYNCGEYYEDVE